MEKIKNVTNVTKNKISHEASNLPFAENGLEKMERKMIERSGINEALEEIDSEITIADIGSGKQHDDKAIIEANPEREIKIIGVDPNDYASERVSESEAGEKIESVFGKGENLPFENEAVEIAMSNFAFQELNDKQQQKVLEEMGRIIKEGGKIIITEDLPQEGFSAEAYARAKIAIYNLEISKLNMHSDEEWRKFFEENGLEVESSEKWGNDEENKKEQFVTYILKKIKEGE
ncbi:MAG: class I SAM-dependent methyltransferase [Patescibacteria group bacterium]|nr:class I SAM-dependent methyltransferase [Patescibacteria group bacterium]